jgi:hypothetical protein
VNCPGQVHTYPARTSQNVSGQLRHHHLAVSGVDVGLPALVLRDEPSCLGLTLSTLPRGEVVAEAIQQDVVEDIGGDEQRVDHIDTGYSNTTFRHLLLPVWIGAYRFQGKVYQVAVNGRTGEAR